MARHEALAALFEHIRERSQQELEWREEIRLQQQDKNLVLVCRGSRLPGQNAGQVVGFDDVTVLTEAQREAAWSEVARRLAHEVKNPLTPIRLAAERMGRKLQPVLDSDHSSLLTRATATIVNQVEALQSLVDAFADYAQDNRAERKALDVHELIDEIVSLYQTASDSIDFRCHLQAKPSCILANPGRTRQVLHNLLRNAQEAHASAGIDSPLHIEISTANEVRENARGVMLRIHDNGPGIDESLLDDVFQPYVSSKQRTGRGESGNRSAGLGLAIVRKIIDDSGGNIQLNNHPDGGAMAEIWLPASGSSTTADSSGV